MESGNTQSSNDDDDGKPIMFLSKRDANFNDRRDDVTTSLSSIIISKPVLDIEAHFTLDKILTETAKGEEKSLIQVLEECVIRSEDKSLVTVSRASNSAASSNTDVTHVNTDVTHVNTDVTHVGSNDSIMLCDQGAKHSQINSFEDREFEFLRVPPTIQRSTSLKQPSKNNSSKSDATAGVARKSVRFADALGLDLASIRHIINPDDPPTVPTCTWRTIARRDEHAANEEVAFWRVRFVQPVVTSPEFRQLVHDRKVALESCSINNQELTAHGVVRVANIAFVKEVKVRYSYNGWLTHEDVLAKYIANSNDLVSDRFYFVFNLPGHLGVRNRIEFAILYTANGQTWWDSNLGYNYTVECIHYLGRE